jgi:citrate lyase synthetase
MKVRLKEGQFERLKSVINEGENDKYNQVVKLDMHYYGSNFKGYEIKRADEDVSSTKVRLALKENNLNEFKRLMPECTWKFYEELTRHMRS